MTKSFQFVAGSEDFLVTRTGAAKWEKLIAGIDDEFGQEVVDGQAGVIAEVEDAVARFASAVTTMPMFGDRKAVWFKGINFLADTVIGRSETTEKAFEKLQSVLDSVDPAQVGILLTAAPVDKRRRGFKWLQKNGQTELVEPKSDPAALGGLLNAEANALGCSFAPGAADALLARIQGNPRLALEEVRKLATYLGDDGGPVTQQHIFELVPTFGEGDMFETVEAFYALDLRWTLDAIHRHFFLGYDARPMITSLQNRNRLLIQMKALVDARALPARFSKGALDQAQRRYGSLHGGIEEKSSFNVFTQHPYYLSRVAAPIGRLSLKQLIEFQHSFLEAFRGILGHHQSEHESVLRETALRCLG